MRNLYSATLDQLLTAGWIVAASLELVDSLKAVQCSNDVVNNITDCSGPTHTDCGHAFM